MEQRARILPTTQAIKEKTAENVGGTRLHLMYPETRSQILELTRTQIRK